MGIFHYIIGAFCLFRQDRIEFIAELLEWNLNLGFFHVQMFKMK